MLRLYCYIVLPTFLRLGGKMPEAHAHSQPLQRPRKNDSCARLKSTTLTPQGRGRRVLLSDGSVDEHTQACFRPQPCNNRHDILITILRRQPMMRTVRVPSLRNVNFLTMTPTTLSSLASFRVANYLNQWQVELG